MLFSSRSIWTMIHGIGLSGFVLMGLAAALFYLYASRSPATAADRPRAFAGLMVLVAAALWLAVIVGTYIIFPEYRATPPEGVTDLAEFPRALLLGNPETAWLHAFAMEIKEHVPWIAAMLATAAAFVTVRYRSVLRDASLRGMVATAIAICLVLVSFAGLLGTFINKVAPLD
jgi:multisubunit Na+/H+ antiporter MnhB subunit